MQDGSTRVARAWSRAHDRDGMGAVRAAGAAVSRTAVLMAASISGMVAGARLAGEDRRHR
jgi:hypothetical protein